MSPRELGKWAKLTGINAPALDSGFHCWLKNAHDEQKKRYHIEWWEGWYDAMNEIISYSNGSFTNKSAA